MTFIAVWLMYSIRKMKALVSDHREGKEVPGWVRFVLEPQPAHADPAAAEPAPEEGRERSRRMKQTLLGLQAPVAERWPAAGPQGRKTMPVAGLPAEDEEPAAQPEAGKRTISGMQAPPGESRLIAPEP